MTGAQKKELGLQDTKSLANRAALCAGCHVGEHSDDGLIVRDVNHDLIAAGHPRLNFEFSAFLDNMPDHWDEKGENAGSFPPNQRAANFSSQAWAIGRLTTTKAALALLVRRVAEIDSLPNALVGAAAVNPKRSPRWPEFSEFGCFSCHHDLRDQRWRRGPREAGKRLGSIPWGTWYLPGMEALLGEIAAGPHGAGSLKALDDVAVAMEQPTPSSAAERRDRLAGITKAAQSGIFSLTHCIEAVATKPLSAATIATLNKHFDDEKGWNEERGWDAVAERYLALVPVYQSWVNIFKPAEAEHLAMRKRIENRFTQLNFPPGFDSPRGFEPGARDARPLP
jgi:hypothetical protein